jgi:putative phosphoribosyl transferase
LRKPIASDKQEKGKVMKTAIKEAETLGTTRDVRIPTGRAHLEGELKIPTGAPGVVLFAHGSGSSRHSPRNQFVARVIRESSNGTLLFDLLTREEEIEDNVSGRLRFDIGLLAQRLVDATRWLAGQPEAGHLGIGYFGSSTGGGAALVAAAEVGKRIGAVVSRGGRPDLAANALPRVESPTLLIVGEFDDVVIRLNEEAFAQLRCEKQMKIIPGATHLFEEEGALEQVARLAADWFRRYLQANSKAVH